MSDDNNGITVTLKAGTGFEAPWIVIHASDVRDAISQIDTGDFATLAERTVSAAEFFRGAHNVKKGLSAQPAETSNRQDGPSWSQQGSGGPAATSQGYAPAQQQQQAPAAPTDAKSCVHGPMVYREAKPGSGKSWRAYFCPTPQGTPNQCKPEFLK